MKTAVFPDDAMGVTWRPTKKCFIHPALRLSSRRWSDLLSTRRHSGMDGSTYNSASEVWLKRIKDASACAPAMGDILPPYRNVVHRYEPHTLPTDIPYSYTLRVTFVLGSLLRSGK